MGFDLVAARTRHVWALVPRSYHILFINIFRESTLVGGIVSCLTNVVGEESFGGWGGPTFSALAVNSQRQRKAEYYKVTTPPRCKSTSIIKPHESPAATMAESWLT